MKPYRLRPYSWLGILGAILAAATILAGLPATAAAATPAARELPALPGDSSAGATAVNIFGTVVGYSVDANFNSRAVKWSPSGAVTDLGSLPGDEYSEATAINNLGQIVGYSGSLDTGIEHGVEWNPAGVIKDLGAVAGKLSESDAYGINDFGEIVGIDNAAPRQVNAILWRNGTIDDFGAAEQNDIGDSEADAVNDLGQIVGSEFVIHGDASHQPVRWNADGSYVQLPLLPNARGRGGSTGAINNVGVTVGSSPTFNFNQPHAVRWDQQGNVTDLGTLSDGIDSAASGINDLGVVVGSAADANAINHAVTWSRTGTLSELPDLPGGSNSEAVAVNDTGLIVGDGTDAAGNQVALLWH
jgi:probable HAF family extracellular repeat protein